ncbi:MAG: S1C family serine protease [Planctomycetia bacterium]
MPTPTVRRAAACLVVLFAARCAAAAGVEDAVLDAQARRLEVIRRASAAAVAIFAGESGGGSGVLVSPDGYAFTNFHVTQPAGPVMQCGLDDGRLYDAVLVGLDPTGDVAVVKLLGRDDFPCVPLADSDRVEVGDFCFAAGNPFLLATDLRPSISAGIVSGVHRYQFPAGTILEYADCLQVDAAINPGNSGGGLFDAAGRLIGVNGRASFEKRGRVNVGVGYAISANQLRNFLGLLKGGRIIDHATLGAVVATSADGKVVVSDLLDSSDAWRRGLRHDDEIVALAGRPVRTVNAFKNVLGTLPAGWQVPLVYRRGGRRFEVLVRLAAVHSAAELAALAAGDAGAGPDKDQDKDHDKGHDQDKGHDRDRKDVPGKEPRPAAARPRLPEALRGLVDPRPGFANHHFNVVERDRVAKAVAARGGPEAWVLSGTLDAGGEFRIALADEAATIDLPTGRSTIDPREPLDVRPEPPGSGGLLAALVVWRRLVREGPVATGRTTYWGTAPADPATIDGSAAGELVDVLESAVAGVEARLYVAADGRVVGIDLWTEPDADPCEVRLAGGAGGLPAVIEVRRGTVPFATLRVADGAAGADRP